MIPEFPTFKRLELSDRRDVEAATASYLPYSDFNFVSLWCWNTDGRCAISRLNGNLVVQFTDYVTNEPLLSFLGQHAPLETSITLLRYASRFGPDPRLRLIPEVAIHERAGFAGFRETVAIDEDAGSADYVLSIPEWVELPGAKFRDKRKALRQFEARFAPSFHTLDLRDLNVQRQIMHLFGHWIEQRQQAGFDETINESLALRRFFSLEPFDGLWGFGVTISGEMRGFLLVETVGHGYVIGHFWKADSSYPGIYPYLLHQMSRHFAASGYQYFNIEQDLGKPGLAQAKRRYRPTHYLRKFVLAWPQTSHLPQQAATEPWAYPFELGEAGNIGI